MKKLFMVNIETEAAVYADSEREAEEIARKNLREMDSYEFAYHAHEMTDLKFCDPDIADSPPYGGQGDKTVRELIEEVRDAKAALNQQELKL